MIKQTKTLLSTRFHEMINVKQYKFVVLAFLMISLMSFVLKEDIFKTYSATRSGIFTLVCASIWLGIFNSIQTICSCRQRIIDDFLNEMRVGSFVLSELIFQIFICFIQTLIVMIVFTFTFSYNKEGIITKSIIEYFIMIFLIIYSSDILGLILSSFVKSSVTAMELMPFVLVIQMILPGTLFELKGILEKFSFFTISKWGMDALGSIANLEKLASNETINIKYNTTECFIHTQEHFVEIVCVFLLFITISGFMTYIGVWKIKKNGL